MTSPGSPVPIDALLAHRAWVRRLARSLVADDARAGDLEQDAWVAALRSPPRHERSLKGWLAQVLRHRARDTARGERRRTSREHACARAEALPGPDEAVARAELARRVTAAALELAEPYRSTIVLRFFDDLSSAEIARREGTSPAAVRKRLQRGLAMLRERLDQEPERDHRKLVLPLVGLPLGTDGAGPDVVAEAVRSGSASALSGGLLVHAKTLSVAAAAAVVLTIALWPDGTAPEDPAATAPRAAAAAPDAAPRDRERVHATSAGPAESAPARTSVDAATAAGGALAVTVRDEQGAPIPGAEVYVTAPDQDVAERASLQIARTDATGTAALGPDAPNEDRDLVVRHPGFRLACVPLPGADAAPAPVVVVLERGARLAGRVVTPEGDGIAGAVIRVEGVDVHARHLSDDFRPGRAAAALAFAELTSGPDGRFDVAGFPDDAEVRLVARADGHARDASGGSARITKTGDRAVSLVLEPIWHARVRCVDDVTGQPVEDVQWMYVSRGMKAIDREGGERRDDGVLEVLAIRDLRQLPPEMPFIVEAEGYERLKARVPFVPLAAADEPPTELRLTPVAGEYGSLQITVRGPEALLPEGETFHFALVAEDGRVLGRRRVPDDARRVELSRVPAGRYTLQSARPPTARGGAATRSEPPAGPTFEPVEVVVFGGDLTRADVHLLDTRPVDTAPPPVTVRVKVVRPDGSPDRWSTVFLRTPRGVVTAGSTEDGPVDVYEFRGVSGEVGARAWRFGYESDEVVGTVAHGRVLELTVDLRRAR